MTDLNLDDLIVRLRAMGTEDRAEIADALDDAAEALESTVAKLREAEAEAARYESAIRQALAFESVLPAIATEPRRILTAALGYKPTNQESGGQP